MEAQSLAESDAGRELLRLLSQHCSQQLQQDSNASAAARGLYGPIGAGRGARNDAVTAAAAASSLTPAFQTQTQQQRFDGPSPYSLLPTRPVPQTRASNQSAVTAAAGALQLQQLLLQQQQQLMHASVSLMARHNVSPTHYFDPNSAAIPFSAVQLQQLQQQQMIGVLPVMAPGVHNVQQMLHISPQPLLGNPQMQLTSANAVQTPFLWQRLRPPQWR